MFLSRAGSARPAHCRIATVGRRRSALTPASSPFYSPVPFGLRDFPPPYQAVQPGTEVTGRISVCAASTIITVIIANQQGAARLPLRQVTEGGHVVFEQLRQSIQIPRPLLCPLAD